MRELLLITGIILLVIVIICMVFIKIIIPRLMVKELEKYQNVLLERQFEEINNTYKKMRGWRHDYKNHMQVLKVYVENKEWQNAIQYICEMNQDLSEVDHVIKTGNVMADAIVNSKVALARTKHINIDITATVPDKLPITDVEFCVIFGNLMDNAIEACDKIADDKDKFIRIYIGLFKKQLYLSVTNATKEKERIRKYTSIKGEGHGLGLYRIDKIVKQKKGYLNRKNEPGVFATEIMIPFLS